MPQADHGYALKDDTKALDAYAWIARHVREAATSAR
ncbi:hypothetical protein ABIA33_006391 [Streptacidiphilus sp. MAP12-16]